MRKNKGWLILLSAVVIASLVFLVVKIPSVKMGVSNVSLSAPQIKKDKKPGREMKGEENERESEESIAEEEEEGSKAITEPGEWFVKQRMYPNHSIPQKAYQKAAKQANHIRKMTAKKEPGFMKNYKWSLSGPKNIGGRIVDIAVDPNQQNTLYIGVATGGVWRSTDGGQTFQQAWDKNLADAMGALAISKNGTIYAGTGEANPGGGSIVFGGSGVYRSTDGGKTWSNVGLQQSGAIGRIAIDPKHPDHIFVAAAGPLFEGGGQRGLYRSTDGGDSWKLVLKGKNSTTGAIDVAIDPKNPQRIYAVMWDHQRFPDKRVYGGKGSGVYRSTDGGDTWVKLTNGLPPSNDNLGRIGLAISPSNPDHLYAIAIKTNGYFQGFYTSLDGGNTWKEIEASQTLKRSQSSYGWWFGRVWVDPYNDEHIFVAGVPLLESKDGGKTWIRSSNVHADQHAMAWDKKDRGRVYLGNDGGFYRSDNNGSLKGEWTEASYEPFTQFYSVAVSRQDPSNIAGGAQDNGSIRSWGGDNWNEYYGGDGQENLINYQNQKIVYACFQYGNCARSTDSGETMHYFTNQTTSDRRNWFTPIVFDPNNPKIMYYGGNRLNRSTDGGKTWEVISPDLTGGPGRGTQYPYGTITTIAASKSNDQVVYVGTDDGRLWVTHNLGKDWTRLKSPNLPKRWVTRVAVDPKHENWVYATFSGFRSGDHKAHVFFSKNGGKAWKDISSNLPDAPVNDIVINSEHHNTLYVATDVGVFMSKSGGEKWYKLGKGLPLTPVMDLEFHKPSETLVAATFGRGIYQVQLKR